MWSDERCPSSPQAGVAPRSAGPILCQQIGRQIAADGGHCERSTHYHRYALDFYALALVAARESGDLEAAPVFADAVTRLAFAARLLADDHGRVPHIGDDDGGALLPILGRDPDDLRASLAVASSLVDRPELRIEDAPEDALWMLGDAPGVPKPRPGAPVPSASLPDTGYYVSRSAAGDHLLIDGGPHGYQNGGHAHADALSLTLAVRGVPLLIDPGTACYTTDPALRDRLRSTALHNTLVVDGRSQSLPAGPFHWSHVANGRVHRWRTHPAFDYFDGSHDGYRPIEHRRRVLSVHGDLVVVADFVAGSGAHAAAVHWHVDPRWSVEMRGRGAVFTRSANRADRVGLSVPQGVIDHFSGDDLTGLGWCSPAYGRIDRATTVRIACNGHVAVLDGHSVRPRRRQRGRRRRLGARCGRKPERWTTEPPSASRARHRSITCCSCRTGRKRRSAATNETLSSPGASRCGGSAMSRPMREC